jgi:hypothetical protein
MSTEQLTSTPATDAATIAASAEKGLLIAMVLLVVLGVSAMLFMI